MATHYLKYGSKEVVSGPQTLSPFLFSYLTFVGGKGMGNFRRAIKLQITETSLRACVSRNAVCGPETSKEASISYLNPSANFCTLHIDPCMCNYRGRMYMCNNIGAGRVYYHARAIIITFGYTVPSVLHCSAFITSLCRSTLAPCCINLSTTSTCPP